MSQMTKFLKQTCQFEPAERDSDGEVQLDNYGDVIVGPEQTLKCRREKIVKDVQTGSGAILRSTTRYYLDENVEIRADDFIDGQTVMEASEYVDAYGKVIGFEVYV